MACWALGVSVGSSGTDLFATLGAALSGDERALGIIIHLRLVRVLMATVVGCGLALAGTVTQAVMRNPLASPFTTGVASGAAFGAALAIFGHVHARWGIASFAFTGALATSLFMLGIARLRTATPGTLVLGGVAIMFLFSSLTSLLQYLGTELEIQSIVFWTFGSMSKAGWTELGVAACMIFIPAMFLARRAVDLDVMMAGDESAVSMGVDAGRLRIEGVLLSSLLTAGAICFTGVIGFVGLVAPHMVRMVVGSSHTVVLPASALLGASLLVMADTVGRTLAPPLVVPVGIVTAFLGVPFFLFLLLRRKPEEW
jgi:iron complex transport system permease protein